MTDIDKNEILTLVEQGKELPEELRTKLLASIKNGEPSIFGDGDYLCCDLGIDGPERYQWVTFDTCRALHGRAADNEKCGH